ncbi:hypothetical protein HYPSUDRAFT_850508 [Hypholoma sublateritium FD-334 SS-4]|uniref:Uncharacterized protein n=1 Tax=Hypholoma sublateritium (strain FD-334 SS-4) TaxID=945553 RepID=A0A0D2KZB9_HYPSF|nr:hypothetical protein HYPSUDRAFT_850508 [Hypholoma sublateritium FD-334 SS-4]
MAFNLHTSYTTRYSIRRSSPEVKAQRESRLSWDQIVSALQNHEHLLGRAICQGKDILRCLIRKRPFCPIDTSNALVWLNTPANLLPPSRPVIHGLPPEILGRIFAFIVHSDCLDKRYQYREEVWVNFVSSGTSPTTPVVLGHVCRAWRTFVHNTPFLWATIFVHSPLPRHVDIVSFWLARTADCPLDLRFEQFLFPDPASLAIIELFIVQAHRWRKIAFIINLEEPFDKLRPGSTPLLEEFRIRLPKWDRARVARVIDTLHASPVLHTINWGKSIAGQIPPSTPWRQLRELSLHNLELSETLLAAFPQCSNLLTLRLYGMRNGLAGQNTCVAIPSVERLVCDQPYMHIFNAFTLPSLVDLKLGGLQRRIGAFETPEAQIAPLISMIERSACTVQALEVEAWALPILYHDTLSHLTILHAADILSSYPSNFRLEDLISETGGRHSLLPALQHLFLDRYEGRDGVLATVAWSRRRTLRTLHVGVDAEQHPRDVITLGWLRKDGMTVEVGEPLSRSRMISFARPQTDAEDVSMSTLRFPDFDTIWT